MGGAREEVDQVESDDDRNDHQYFRFRGTFGGPVLFQHEGCDLLR
jgi:hypothetical protein